MELAKQPLWQRAVLGILALILVWVFLPVRPLIFRILFLDSIEFVVLLFFYHLNYLIYWRLNFLVGAVRSLSCRLISIGRPDPAAGCRTWRHRRPA